MNKLIIGLVCSLVSLGAIAGGNIDSGKALAAKYNCASCHGANFTTPIDPSYPKLAGQHADYIEHALRAYKRGDGPNGRNNAIMGAFAKQLSNKDMADLAAYLHSLPSELVLKR